MVFEHTRSQKDLLSFALVCRGWTEWALDMRWRRCDVPISAIVHPLLSMVGESSSITPSLAGIELRVIIFASQEPTWRLSLTDEEWAAFMALSTKVTSVTCDSRLPSGLSTLLEIRLKTLGPSDEKPFQRVRKFTAFLSQTDRWIAFLVRDLAALSSYKLCGERPPNDPFAILSEVVEKTSTITNLEIDLPHLWYIPDLGSISQLQRLSCRRLDIPLDWWNNLSQCKKLSDLRLEGTLRRGSEVNYLEEELASEVATFPALRRLLLDAREWNVTVLILNSRFPILEYLSFGSCSLSAGEMEQVRMHLSDCSPHLRL
ncbi:hypothetical protein FRC01_001073 [Tulasnella sp. 417]|nr:hypothetical protein FRC01_001073 [Tulasnella sp. 417]